MQLIKEYINNSGYNIGEMIQYSQTLIDKFIREPLKISINIPRKALFEKIIQDIKSLGFILDFPDMPDFDNNFIKAIQRIDGGDRRNGGIIKVNKKLDCLAKAEGILHEYIHLKLPIIPILTTDKESNYYWIDSKPYNLTITELLVEFCFLNLWLPKDNLLNELKSKEYNIDEFIKSYKGVKLSTLLQWIALICPFTCHFAWVVIPKDGNNYFLPDICDKFRYTHNPINKLEDFQFDVILRNPNSIAARALAARESRSGISTLNNTSYRCYAYYERDKSRSRSNAFFPGINSENYDQLIVIGWNEDDYLNFMQNT